ncbi:MAG: glycosyltransferase family 39 protein [Acidimicrobiia bacterium]
MERRERAAVGALTGAFILLGLVFAVAVPLFGNYDERTHVDRARYTARQPLGPVGPDLDMTFGSWAALAQVAFDGGGPDRWDRVPTDRPDYPPFGEYPGGDRQQHQDCPGPCQNYQYIQPPGWYLAVAPLVAALDDRPFPATVLALRVVGVVLVAAMVPLAWWTARQLWPGRRRRALATAALVAAWGPLAFTAAGANNDGLMLPFAGGVVAAMAAILRRGNSWRRCLALGLVLGAGLWVKVELVTMAPLAAAAVLLCAPRGELTRTRAALVAAVPVLPGALWWSWRILGGHVLSPEASEILAPPRPGPWASSGFTEFVVEKTPVLFDRVWGFYDFPPFLVGPGWRVLLWALTTAVVGGGVACWLASSRRSGGARERRWLVLAAVPAALVASVLYASYRTFHRNGEVRALVPRYLYTALPVLALGLVGSGAAIAARFRPRRAGDRSALPLLVLAAAAVGGAGSVAVCLTGMYGTRSLPTLLDRAGAIAPVDHVGVWLAALAAAWAIFVAAAAALAATIGNEAAAAERGSQ